MNFSEETVTCRFCLKKLTENCEPIEEIIQHTLNFLTICPNLTISDDPMICKTCAMNLNKCFDFKTRCLSTEDCIASFTEGEDKNVDLRDIYLKVKLDGNIDKVPDDHSVCRFCLELVKNHTSMSVRHDVELLAILHKYFLEMDLRITDDIIACTPCYNSFRFHASFVNNYESIEGKINEYCKVEGAKYKDQVDLKDVAAFISKSMLNDENISNLMIKEENYENIVCTNVDVKVKFEDPMDMEQEEKKLVQQKNRNGFQLHPSPSKSNCIPQLTRVKEYNCEICSFKTKAKGYLKKHMLKHRDASEVTMYRCAMCSYQTKRKQHLQTHMITHKSDTEVTMYKCDLCNHVTKWSSSLKNHMLTHKSQSDTTMYKCKECSYKTKHKNYLQQHALIHMEVSEIKMHKCEMCSFETIWKSNFQTHLLSHRNPADVVTRGTMYKCDLCDYKGKRRFDLKRHMLTHKTQSEVTMYKCDLCDYEAKRNADLKKHMLIHKDHSETIMYKCETCAYETKHKDYLLKHMRIHMDSSRIEMHKCEVCPFEAKWKRALRRHLVSHSNLM